MAHFSPSCFRRWLLALAAALIVLQSPAAPPAQAAANPLAAQFVLSGGPVSENFAANSIVGLFQVQNAGAESFTFTLNSAYGDAAAFVIKDPASGRLWNTLKFDYETKTSYTIQASANGSLGSRLTQTFTIQIQNADDNPPADIVFSPDPVTVNENLGPRRIATFTTLDADGPGFAHSYTLSGADAAFFTLHPGGELWTTTAFDWEALPAPQARTLTLQVTDTAGSWRRETFPVYIGNVADQRPTGMSLSGSHRVSRSAARGFEIGQFSASDPDLPSPGDSFTYQLLPGGCPGSAKFASNGARLLLNADLRYEQQPYLTICVQVTDSVGFVYPADGKGKQFSIILDGAPLTLDYRLFLPVTRN